MSTRSRRSAGAYGRGGSKLGIGALWLTLAASAAGACNDTSIALRDGQAAARFTIEIADDANERARGLMFREEMPVSSGMLFIYDGPQPVSFWMRNMLIPLYIIFISADGTVARIHENAQPLDETSIFGGDAIQYVLEINGGLAERLGIGEGAVVQHPATNQAIAAFPCE